MPVITEITDPNYDEKAKAMDSFAAQDAERCRDEGNAHFKAGELDKALFAYSEGIKMSSSVKMKKNKNEEIVALLYRNRAAVHLKLENFSEAEADCTSALEFDMDDTKALYRRALAREGQGSVGEAFKDAKLAIRSEPKNKTLIELMQRLVKANAKKHEEALSTENRVQDMVRLAFNSREEDKFGQNWVQNSEKRVQAMNNLMVLARESEAGADKIWKKGLVPELLDCINKDPDKEVTLAAIRVLDELAKQEKRAFELMEHLSFKKIFHLINCRGPKWPEFIDATAAFGQRFFNAVARMDRTKEKKPDPEFSEKNKVLIVRMVIELEDMLTDPNVCAVARESVIDLILKNITHMDGGLPRGWSWRFVQERGLPKIMDVACQIPEQCKFPVTAETRQHVSVCLARIWDDMVFDTKRAIFKEVCEKYFKEKLEKVDDMKQQIEMCAYLTTMLQGVADVGFNLVTNPKITEMMLQMAASEHVLHQAVAVELLIATSSKRERAETILSQAIPVLKKLYESKDDGIKARALMGLCKCASAGGDDVSRQMMADGSTQKLAASCKKFLVSKKTTIDMRRFAAEGLSYLTLDAEVKEWLVEDNLTIKALVELAKQAGAVCVYALASIFVHLSNSYEKPEVTEEMVKLAQFAKHHVPETHEKDTEEYIDKRVDIMVRNGATSACVAASKTESHHCLELLARCLAAFTVKEEHRGIVVKEGGAKLLLRLSLEGNIDGKTRAAQAIARIGIKMDPEIVFPGQRAYEVVRPLLELLHVENTGLQNYEALLTLTNLASMSDSVRRRMVKEKCFWKIEEYWFMQDHADLRAAAAELLLNLIHNQEALKEQLRETTDRLKLWTLYSADEDERLAKASAAGLAMMTGEKDACIRITKIVTTWLDIMKEFCMREDPELQYRGMLVVANMLESDESVAAQMMQSQIFEVLVAIIKMDDPTRKRAKDVALRCLHAAEKWGFIAPTARENYERKHNISTVVKDPAFPAVKEEEEGEGEDEN